MRIQSSDSKLSLCEKHHYWSIPLSGSSNHPVPATLHSLTWRPWNLVAELLPINLAKLTQGRLVKKEKKARFSYRGQSGCDFCLISILVKLTCITATELNMLKPLQAAEERWYQSPCPSRFVLIRSDRIAIKKNNYYPGSHTN